MQPIKGNYLVKDVIYEQNKRRQYDFHRRKLKEIISQVQVISKVQPLSLDSQQIMQKLNYKHEQTKLTQQFVNQEMQIEKSRIDNHLLHQLMKTNALKSTQNTLSTSRSQKRNTKTNMQLNTINDQNKSLATRIYSLPSVISSQQQFMAYKSHISDLKIMQRFHKQKPLNYQDPLFTIILNELGKSFQESKYQSLQFLQTVSKTQKFCFFIPIKLNLNSKFSQTGVNPSNFFIQAFFDNTFLGKGVPLEIHRFLNSITGFSIPEHFFTLKFKLIKIKQNEDAELGHFTFTESYSSISTKQLKENLAMKISDPIEGLLKKEIGDEAISVGTIEYYIVQFCWSTKKQPTIKPAFINAQYQIEVQQASPQKSARKTPSQIEELI